MLMVPKLVGSPKEMCSIIETDRIEEVSFSGECVGGNCPSKSQAAVCASESGEERPPGSGPRTSPSAHAEMALGSSITLVTVVCRPAQGYFGALGGLLCLVIMPERERSAAQVILGTDSSKGPCIPFCTARFLSVGVGRGFAGVFALPRECNFRIQRVIQASVCRE